MISYSYGVTNTGNVTLDGPVTVIDDKASGDVPGAAASLAPGGVGRRARRRTRSRRPTWTPGSVTNTATASANGTRLPTDTETVTAAQSPALSLGEDGEPDDV